MNTKNLLGFFVAMSAIVLAVVLFTPAVAAGTPFGTTSFGNLAVININGLDRDQFVSGFGVTSGDELVIRVSGQATADAEDTRFTAEILGVSGTREVSERFDAFMGSQYPRILSIPLPNDLDRNLLEEFDLRVTWENQRGGSEEIYTLRVQRQNDRLEIISVEFSDNIKAGETLPIDVVVKNLGTDEAEDTFVRASLVGTGASKTIFLGDLEAIDSVFTYNGVTELDSDFEDSAYGRVLLSIPKDTVAGVYDLEIVAFDDDSTSTIRRKVVVSGTSADSRVLASPSSKTFASGTEQTYSLTIVNADNEIKVYEIIPETSSGLSVRADEALVAVPAGSSKTVQLSVMAENEGTYDFAVNVHSDGELVGKQSFVAIVDGSDGAGGSAAVVLTIILAIIFVVLLIVLIVLLTRKPEKSDELGESYY